MTRVCLCALRYQVGTTPFIGTKEKKKIRAESDLFRSDARPRPRDKGGSTDFETHVDKHEENHTVITCTSENGDLKI